MDSAEVTDIAELWNTGYSWLHPLKAFLGKFYRVQKWVKAVCRDTYP